VTRLSVFACDPGPTTGIARLEYPSLDTAPIVTLLQVEGNSVLDVLSWLLSGIEANCDYSDRKLAAIERFVTNRSAGSRGKDADFTRELIPRVEDLFKDHAYQIFRQSPAEVKPWAIDKRLVKITPQVKASIHGKSRDAFDALRHGLYCAVRNGGAPDPLA
jgi:hypothetical protein